MDRIVLVRHAQASFGAEDYDRLSPLGHQQSDWLAQYFRDHDLRFDRVFRGSLRRHRETTQAVLNHALAPDPVEDARFNEIDYDVLEAAYLQVSGARPAASRADFLALFPEIMCHWAECDELPGHVRYTDFVTRIMAALDDAARHSGTTLIVTSGGVIGTILRQVLGLTPRGAAELMLNIHNASVHELTREAGVLRLSLFNASPHFDPRDRSHARTYI